MQGSSGCTNTPEPAPLSATQTFAQSWRGLTEANGIHLLGFSFASKESALSTQWGFTYLGRYYAYMSGKNSRFDEFSPGRLHLGMVIEACKNRGIDILELMAPASEYKLTWANTRGSCIFVHAVHGQRLRPPEHIRRQGRTCSEGGLPSAAACRAQTPFEPTTDQSNQLGCGWRLLRPHVRSGQVAGLQLRGPEMTGRLSCNGGDSRCANAGTEPRKPASSDGSARICR